MEVTLSYEFFNDPLDKKKLAYHERFLAARLSDKSILGHQVKLFVHTSSKSPPKFVSTLVEQSGGKVIKKRIR